MGSRTPALLWWFDWHHRCVPGLWESGEIPHLFGTSVPPYRQRLTGSSWQQQQQKQPALLIGFASKYICVCVFCCSCWFSSCSWLNWLASPVDTCLLVFTITGSRTTWASHASIPGNSCCHTCHGNPHVMSSWRWRQKASDIVPVLFRHWRPWSAGLKSTSVILFQVSLCARDPKVMCLSSAEHLMLNFLLNLVIICLW